MLNQVVGHVTGFFHREPTLVLWDMADIFLVAVVLYYVLLLLKGTRAMQMGFGLALLFVVYQVAKRLGLITLYAMLDSFLASIVLIIVVLFQQDIRRALMQFGRRSFFGAGRTEQETHVIDEVARAATALAQKRIGALIVFERVAVLDEFIESGTTLDAAVAKELLYSIFVPSFENPMHDGAAIIRDGRVWQAGAFLPLSASPKLERTLGTRHRAALGITEETDAVVVVVSEERGAISLCFNGNIVRNLDGTSLRKVLAGLFSSSGKRRMSKPDGEGGARRSTPPPRPSTPSQPPPPAPQDTNEGSS
jgi:diadenylate cyclase